MTRDLRKFARQTHTRLLIGFLLLLFIVGDGLIFVLYGRAAAMMGLLCLGAGAAPLLIIFLFLRGMEWLVERANSQ